MALFKYENEIFGTIEKIGDCIALSVLWTVSSLPVVTMGAATTALYHTITKVIRNERGTAWREYWSAFCANFKQSTVIWLIYLAIFAFLGGGMVYSYRLAPTNGAFGFLTIVCLLLLNAAVVVGAFTLFYAGRFIFPTQKLLKNCYLISLINIGWFVVMWFILVLVPYVLFITINPHIIFLVLAIPILPSAIVLLLSFVCEHVFAKYISQKDKDENSIYD